jgi:dienelactone hydrolase
MRNGLAVLRAIAGLAVLAFWAPMSSAQAPDGGYRVFRPDGTGPHPALAFVSGCSGFKPAVAPKAYERVAENLRAEGYVVLFVDYLGRRGLRNCSREPTPEGEVAKDLVAAVAWLRSQHYVDSGRISALGWSYGGGAVLVALADYTGEQVGISRAVVFYPICRAVRPWRVATPVLMLLGGDDEVAPNEACQAAVKKSAVPDAVKTVTYHGALHAFDVSDLPAETRGVGGMIGYNAQAAAAAWGEIRRFLMLSK